MTKLKIQIVTYPKKNPNIDKTKQNQTVTKLKKRKLWQNSRPQTEIKLKTKIVTKLERSNCDQTQKLKLCKTKKIKLWQLKNSNCDSNKNDISDRSSYYDYYDIFLVKNTLTPWQPTNSQGSFSQLLRCFVEG